MEDNNERLANLVDKINSVYADLAFYDPARHEGNLKRLKAKPVTLIIEEAWENMQDKKTPLNKLEAFYKTLDEHADELKKIIEQEPTVWSTLDKVFFIFEELRKGHFNSIFSNLGNIFELFQQEIPKKNQPIHEMKNQLDDIRANYTSETADAPGNNDDEQQGNENILPSQKN